MVTLKAEAEGLKFKASVLNLKLKIKKKAGDISQRLNLAWCV